MSYRDVVLRRAAPTMMSEEELQCSVCFELPPGEVHQCTRGHFLCVACWNGMDEAWGGRKCPECRVPLGRSNRCRVAELAIKNLPRPDGYTTPPLAQERPNNRGDALTPLLEGQRTRELEEKLRTSQANVEELERRLEEEIAARAEEARANEARSFLKEAQHQEKRAQLEQKLKDQAAMLCTAQAEIDKIRRELEMQIIERNDERKNNNRVIEDMWAKVDTLVDKNTFEKTMGVLNKKAEVLKGVLAERSRQLKEACKERDEMAARLAVLENAE